MKRQRCDDCGKRDGDRAPDGRILLVFEPGMESEPKLCAPCIDARRPTILAEMEAPRYRTAGEMLRALTAPNQLIGDAPYRGPPAFIDPLEQLELGRMRDDPAAFIEKRPRGPARPLAARDVPQVRAQRPVGEEERAAEATMTVHRLKTLPAYFQAQIDGVKTFEARKDDRGFQVGDILELAEWSGWCFTGRELRRRVTYILRGPVFGVESRYCVMATVRM